MKVSLNWLKDYVNLNCSAHDFSEAMTMSGTKVEGYEILDDKLHGILVGKILSVVPHPDSDHMVVCQVEVGGERLCRSSPVHRTCPRATWFPCAPTAPCCPMARPSRPAS